MRKIYVLDRGWVITSKSAWVNQSNGELKLEGADVIRLWGTTKGLGELAANGPTENTKLDALGTVAVPAKSIVFVLDAPGWA